MLNMIAMATTEKRIRLMARLSNIGQSFDFGDRHESLAGIVALFGLAHNLLTRGISISHKARPTKSLLGTPNLTGLPVSGSDSRRATLMQE
jgi:hypothetical protein